MLDEEKNNQILEAQNLYESLSSKNNPSIKIILNIENNKNSSLNNKKILINNLDILDFNEGLRVKETDNNMITVNKIKNKKEFYKLTKKQKIILDKTIDNNKKGFYFNMKPVNNNKQINVVPTKDILKNILITLVRGNIYYNKDLKKFFK